MIEIFSAMAGMGLFITAWSLYSILYELTRHRSMLEYPYPDLRWFSFLLLAVGLGLWFIGGYFA
jgi:hypothetical protein